MPKSRKDLLDDIVEMQQEMVRNFQDLLVGAPPMPALHTGTWSPPTDVYETAETIVVRMEIPGIDPRELNVLVERGRLIIQGKRNDKPRKERLQFHQMEVHFGAFQRVVHLPDAIEEEGVRSSYADGFLEVVVPKASPRKATKIVIQISG